MEKKIFKIGDRVKLIKKPFSWLSETAEIIDISESWMSAGYIMNGRFKVKYLNVLEAFWVSEDDIILDIEYYRNLKLENILN